MTAPASKSIYLIEHFGSFRLRSYHIDVKICVYIVIGNAKHFVHDVIIMIITTFVVFLYLSTSAGGGCEDQAAVFLIWMTN